MVDLLVYAAKEQVHIDLLSDQTSCHAAYDGGYSPAGLTFEERTRMLHGRTRRNSAVKVDATLKRHFSPKKSSWGGARTSSITATSFMKAVYDAGVTEIARNGSDKNGFIFPSYVEDIMGP